MVCELFYTRDVFLRTFFVIPNTTPTLFDITLMTAAKPKAVLEINEGLRLKMEGTTWDTQ